ncbi:S1 family peptidase [Nonomuraea sp. B10E15]|uniref:S1 family peptidase n=1 Tax=Nonomuraea sp. B10E15 TaxID=3153560 RepID=UPI00325D4180
MRLLDMPGGKMKTQMTVTSILAVALVVTPGLAQAASSPTPPDPSAQASDQGGRQQVLLPREQQPKVQRPTLDKLSREAKANGISLREALDRYAAEIVASNPSALAETPDGPASDPSIKIDGIPFEELVDLSRLAETKGITMEEAIDRYAWIPQLNDVYAKLNDAFPDALSGIRSIHDGRGARIGFKGEIPQEAVELAKTLPVQVEIVGNKGFSQKELREVLNSRSRKLGTQSEVSEFVGRYDLDTGIIAYDVALQKNLKDPSVRDRALSGLQPEAAANPNIRIHIKLNDSLDLQPTDNYLRGGAILDGTDADGNGIATDCTSGFNIISGSGERATTTARHCADDEAYFRYNNHPSYDTGQTTLGRMFRAPDFDFARYQTGSTTYTYTRTFYYALNRTRYARAGGTSPRVDDPVCTFGRTSDTQDGAYRCGIILESDVDYMMEGRTYHGGIKVDIHTKGGDSGGPLFYGSTAWGITSGSVASGISIWAATDRINDSGGMGSNWNVWTCPTC